MHSFSHSRHHHSKHSKAAVKETKGLVLNSGWRYDLEEWFHNIFSFRGAFRELRQRTINMAGIQPGEQVLDVGCGTGTLALEAALHAGRAGHVTGIDPGELQIARARVKAARRHIDIDFQVGVIEQLPFSEQTFDVVVSSLMMHHLPTPLKRQGLAQIAHVLKAGGRLVIADFTHKQERTGQAARLHVGGSRLQDLESLLKEAGFDQLTTEELRPPRFSAFPGASIVCAYKS